MEFYPSLATTCTYLSWSAGGFVVGSPGPSDIAASLSPYSVQLHHVYVCVKKEGRYLRVSSTPPSLPPYSHSFSSSYRYVCACACVCVCVCVCVWGGGGGGGRGRKRIWRREGEGVEEMVKDTNEIVVWYSTRQISFKKSITNSVQRPNPSFRCLSFH